MNDERQFRLFMEDLSRDIKRDYFTLFEVRTSVSETLICIKPLSNEEPSVATINIVTDRAKYVISVKKGDTTWGGHYNVISLSIYSYPSYNPSYVETADPRSYNSYAKIVGTHTLSLSIDQYNDILMVLEDRTGKVLPDIFYDIGD